MRLTTMSVNKRPPPLFKNYKRFNSTSQPPLENILGLLRGGRGWSIIRKKGEITMEQFNAYAGGFSIFLSLSDAKLQFYAVNPIADGNGNIIGEKKEEQALITLSLPIAKQLSEQLSVAIQQYESKVAPIISLEGTAKRIRESKEPQHGG